MNINPSLLDLLVEEHQQKLVDTARTQDQRARCVSTISPSRDAIGRALISIGTWLRGATKRQEPTSAPLASGMLATQITK